LHDAIAGLDCEIKRSLLIQLQRRPPLEQLANNWPSQLSQTKRSLSISIPSSSQLLAAQLQAELALTWPMQIFAKQTKTKKRKQSPKASESPESL